MHWVSPPKQIRSMFDCPSPRHCRRTGRYSGSRHGERLDSVGASIYPGSVNSNWYFRALFPPTYYSMPASRRLRSCTARFAQMASKSSSLSCAARYIFTPMSRIPLGVQHVKRRFQCIFQWRRPVQTISSQMLRISVSSGVGALGARPSSQSHATSRTSRSKSTHWRIELSRIVD